jgi:hypothetical protein
MIASLSASRQRGLSAALALLDAAIVDSLEEPYAGAAVHLLLNRSTIDVEVPSPRFSWLGELQSFIVQAQDDNELAASLDSQATTQLLLDATFGAHQLQFKHLSENGVDRDFWALWENVLRGFGVSDPRSIIDRVRPLNWH